MSRAQPLRLMETFRTVFYTPIYVTVAGGFLESEGFAVDFATCPSQFPHPLSALNHGAADIVQSGIMRSIIAADWGAESVPRHFAEVNSRDGFFLLGRQPQDEFTWDSCAGSTVIPVGFSPMPWASLQWALRHHGVDPKGVNLIPGLPLNEAIDAFRQGRGDYIHLPEPALEQLLEEGVGYLNAALGPLNGHIAYSSFAATNSFMDRHDDTMHRFVRGYARALNWLAQSDEAEIGKAIQLFFPDVAGELLVRAVARLKHQGNWPVTPHLAQPQYEGLQEILMAAGMVKEHQPYEKVVTTAFTKDLA